MAGVLLLGTDLDDVADVLDDGLGGDAVGLVVGVLDGAAAGGLVYGHLHGVGDRVGVHDDGAVLVTGGAADGLDQGPLGAQEPFLVGVQDGHQGYLGDIQALAEQVDAHQHIEHPQA